MKKNLSIALLFVTTLLFLGWGMQQYHQVQQLKSEHARAEKQLTEMMERKIARLRGQIAQLQHLAQDGNNRERLADKERRQYEDTIKALQARLAQNGDVSSNTLLGASAQAVEPTLAPTVNPLTAEMAKNWQCLDMNKLVESQRRLMLDTTTGSLLRLLNLPEKQQSAFKDLLEKKQSESMNVDPDVLNGQAPFEQRQANQTRIAEALGQVDKENETLLGKENYNIYKAYEESQSERLKVEAFNQSMGSDLQLNEAQANDLVWAMHDARSSFSFTTGLDQPYAAMDPAQVSPDSIAQYMRETRQLNERYLEGAGKLLRPDQLEKFRASLEQQQMNEENEIGKILNNSL